MSRKYFINASILVSILVGSLAIAGTAKEDYRRAEAIPKNENNRILSEEEIRLNKNHMLHRYVSNVLNALSSLKIDPGSFDGFDPNQLDQDVPKTIFFELKNNSPCKIEENVYAAEPIQYMNRRWYDVSCLNTKTGLPEFHETYDDSGEKISYFLF